MLVESSQQYMAIFSDMGSLSSGEGLQCINIQRAHQTLVWVLPKGQDILHGYAKGEGRQLWCRILRTGQAVRRGQYPRPCSEQPTLKPNMITCTGHGCRELPLRRRVELRQQVAGLQRLCQVVVLCTQHKLVCSWGLGHCTSYGACTLYSVPRVYDLWTHLCHRNAAVPAREL